MLQDGKIAGAGLDVFEHEPAVNPKLVKLASKGKVVILPHMGSATIEGRIDMGEKVIINIRAFIDGHRPPDRVLPNRSLDVTLTRPSAADCHAAALEAGMQASRSSFIAIGVGQPISRATIRPSSRIASGSCSTSAAGAWPAWTSSSSTAEAEDEPIVPGRNSTRAGNRLRRIADGARRRCGRSSDRPRPRS